MPTHEGCWITDELRSLEPTHRAEVILMAIRHNDLTQLLISRDMTDMEKFKLSSALRDLADVLERQVFKRSN
jgi:hypothetical protein